MVYEGVMSLLASVKGMDDFEKLPYPLNTPSITLLQLLPQFVVSEGLDQRHCGPCRAPGSSRAEGLRLSSIQL